jgi:hypothetical protein
MSFIRNTISKAQHVGRQVLSMWAEEKVQHEQMREEARAALERYDDVRRLFQAPGWQVLMADLQERFATLSDGLRRADKLQDIRNLQCQLNELEYVMQTEQREREHADQALAILENLKTKEKEAHVEEEES